MAQCLIGIGSNVGDRADNLRQAVDQLHSHPRVEIRGVSSWFATAPVGRSDQPEFLNGAIRAETSLSPHELLALLLDIEVCLGRTRVSRWGPRTIDLDLLLYDDARIHDSDLMLPHPWLALRRFVLAPALQVAAELVHPEIGWTVERIWHHLTSSPPYLAVTGVLEDQVARIVREAAASVAVTLLADPVASRSDAAQAASGAQHAHAGRSIREHIELLQGRAECVCRKVANAERLVVSDFWWAQSLAEIRRDLSGDELARCLTLYDELAAATPPARAIIMFRWPSFSAECDRRIESVDQDLQKRQAALGAEVSRPGRGPFLVLAVTALADAVRELTGAIEGVR